MKPNKDPDPLELHFTLLVMTIEEGRTKGIKWKDTAKVILWADKRIKELEEQLNQQ